jgi:hypothetical protein
MTLWFELPASTASAANPVMVSASSCETADACTRTASMAQGSR